MTAACARTPVHPHTQFRQMHPALGLAQQRQSACRTRHHFRRVVTRPRCQFGDRSTRADGQVSPRSRQRASQNATENTSSASARNNVRREPGSGDTGYQASNTVSQGQGLPSAAGLDTLVAQAQPGHGRFEIDKRRGLHEARIAALKKARPG